MNILAAMFDLGGEPPPSFYYTGYAFLFLSLVVLPLGFIWLWRRMVRAAIPKPPVFPYFCIFGTVGGYLLIAALSPSPFTLLILPFLPLAALSLAGSLIYLSYCRPFTGFHTGAVVGCSLLLAPFVFVLFIATTNR